MDSPQSQPRSGLDRNPGLQSNPSASTTERQFDVDTPDSISVSHTTSQETSKGIAYWPRERRSRYEEAWNRLDRLAFALAKVDLATWEHTRIKDRLSNSRNEDLEETDDAIHYFTTRLRQSLLNLGMTRHRIARIMEMCQNEELQRGMRMPIEYESPSRITDQHVLHDLGIKWRQSKVCSRKACSLRPPNDLL